MPTTTHVEAVAVKIPADCFLQLTESHRGQEGQIAASPNRRDGDRQPHPQEAKDGNASKQEKETQQDHPKGRRRPISTTHQKRGDKHHFPKEEMEGSTSNGEQQHHQKEEETKQHHPTGENERYKEAKAKAKENENEKEKEK